MDMARSKHGWRISLRNTRTSVFADNALIGRLRRSYPVVFSNARPDGSRQMVLLVVDRAPRGYLRLVDAAALLATANFLPADSGFEVRMADALVAAGRRFVKPLRYDHADEILPDFVLGDVDPPVAIEVWGVTGRALYEVNRQRKRQVYDERRATLSLLEWHVADPLPDVGLR